MEKMQRKNNRRPTAPIIHHSGMKLGISNEEKKQFITSFFENLAELNIALTNKSLFNILILKESKRILFTENIYTKDNELNKFDKFMNIYKYYCIILIVFAFLSKDEYLYQFKVEKVKELFNQFIYVGILNVENMINHSNKIKNILNEQLKIKNQNIIPITKNIIKITIDQKNEYINIKKSIHQLLDDCQNLDLNMIIKSIKETILFCFLNKLPVNIHNETDDDDKVLIPPSPFIKKPLEKNFCLVLDLDETLSHNSNLSFGNYFLLRPGVINFLTKVSIYFEIIIFTSSAQSYANSILDKIDQQKKFFSYRLYKKHTSFEGGKTIKDLSKIGRDLKKIIFVDNLRVNAKYQLDNLYLIKTWTDDIMDNELEILGNYLESIVNSGKFNDDIRKGLSTQK